MKYVVLKVDSTGRSPTKDRIVSLAIVVVVDDEIVKRGRIEVNPGREVHPRAVEAHGLTDAYLAGQQTFAEKADRLLSFVEGQTLVGFNLKKFDLVMLRCDLERAGKAAASLALTAVPVVDVYQLSKHLCPGYKSHSLQAVMSRYSVGMPNEDKWGASLAKALAINSVLTRMRKQHPQFFEGDWVQASQHKAPAGKGLAGWI